MSCSPIVWTYHWGDEWGCDLLGHQVLPVDWREEGMVLEFKLEGGKKEMLNQQTRLKANKLHWSLSMLCVLNLQSHPSLPASWCSPSAGAPRAAPFLRLTHWVWAQETCAGCCCTSQLCCDCRTGAVKQKSKNNNLSLLNPWPSCTKRRLKSCRFALTSP